MSPLRAALPTLLLLASLLAGAEGERQPVVAPPARIASLSPSATDLVLALGLGDRLVGVSRFDERPEVAKLPRLGGITDPSLEAIAGSRPEVVLLQPSPLVQEQARTLAGLKIRVLAPELGTIREVLAAEREVGRQLGVAAQGEALARALEVKLAETAARHTGGARPSALVVYGWQPLVVAGPGSFADDLLTAAGGSNAARSARQPYATFSAEAAAASRPAVLIDATGGEPVPAALRSLPGLKEARWVVPPTRALLHPGPGLDVALGEVEQLLHAPKPEATKTKELKASPTGPQAP